MEWRGKDPEVSEKTVAAAARECGGGKVETRKRGDGFWG